MGDLMPRKQRVLWKQGIPNSVDATVLVRFELKQICNHDLTKSQDSSVCRLQTRLLFSLRLRTRFISQCHFSRVQPSLAGAFCISARSRARHDTENAEDGDAVGTPRIHRPAF